MVGHLLAVEVLGQDVVVGLGGGLEELVAAAGDLVGHVIGDGDLDFVGAVPAIGLAMDEVDVAAERLGGTDGQLERRDLGAERRTQRVEGGQRIGVLAVALVDEEARRPVGRPTQGHRLFEAGLDTARCVDHEQRPVGGGEALHDLGHEIGIAGRVDE